MARADHRKMLVELCETFGLNPRDVTSITVTCEAMDYPRAVVKMLASNDSQDKVVQMIREYVIIPQEVKDGPQQGDNGSPEQMGTGVHDA
jgi:hypothetical protein